jgi:YlmC/YmxH family sporulation protein
VETSFLELRCKEVINVVDGRRLGHIIDIIIELNSGRVLGFIVPGDRSFWNVFKSGQELFIPFSQVCKIGEDSILVEIFSPMPSIQGGKFGQYNPLGKQDGEK